MRRARGLARGLVVLCLLGLTGCQSFRSGSSTANVRIIHSSPDAPRLDVYEGTSALSYNLTFGNITSYVALTPGPVDLSTKIGGTHQTILKTRETIAGGHYTLLVGGAVAGLQQILLKDRVNPAPPGQIALRLITQVTAIAAFDVYLVPAGSSLASVTPILVNQAFGANSGYLNFPAGSYRLLLYPAGTVPSSAIPAAYAGPTVVYPSGAVRTFVLLDQQTPLRPPVQVILASDVDPSVTASEPTPVP